MKILGTKNTAAGWAGIREERDARLVACDWTMLADAPLSDDLRAAWVAYRKLLRDLPLAGHVGKIVWPDPPKG